MILKTSILPALYLLICVLVCTYAVNQGKAGFGSIEQKDDSDRPHNYPLQTTEPDRSSETEISQSESHSASDEEHKNEQDRHRNQDEYEEHGRVEESSLALVQSQNSGYGADGSGSHVWTVLYVKKRIILFLTRITENTKLARFFQKHAMALGITAIAMGTTILLSTVLLSIYLCKKSRGRRLLLKTDEDNNGKSNTNFANDTTYVIYPPPYSQTENKKMEDKSGFSGKQVECEINTTEVV